MEKRKWYEKYLPFVARSPEMQLRWLDAAFRKGALHQAEITPYVRLFMAMDGEGKPERIRELLVLQPDDFLEKMLAAAEIYDIPDLFRAISHPTLTQAVLALIKAPPPYEKNRRLIVDRVLQAIDERSEELLDQAARVAMGRADCPADFRGHYERFKEVKEDEKLLSSLFPKAIL